MGGRRRERERKRGKKGRKVGLRIEGARREKGRGREKMEERRVEGENEKIGKTE